MNNEYCSAIAVAIPSNVRLLFFQRSALGARLFCPPFVWFAHLGFAAFVPQQFAHPYFPTPSGSVSPQHTRRGATSFVGFNRGKFLSHRHVALLASSPNCHG